MRSACVELSARTLHDAAFQGMLWLAHSTLPPNASTSDEAQCFLTISRNARDPFLSEQAGAIHRELIDSYQVDSGALRRFDQPEQFIDPLSFCTQAEKIGAAHPYKERLRQAVLRRGETFFWNVQPDQHDRGNCFTLITYYHFGRLGYPMSHCLQEVISLCGPNAVDRSLPLSEDPFEEQLYFVTHWVYALSDYGAVPLSPALYNALHGFLVEVLPDALDYGNLETLGEVVECLKIFGHRNSEPLLRPALRNILKRQNPDGSWGSARYGTLAHSTWCAVTALYEYREPSEAGDWGPPARRSYIEAA